MWFVKQLWNSHSEKERDDGGLEFVNDSDVVMANNGTGVQALQKVFNYGIGREQ